MICSVVFQFVPEFQITTSKRVLLEGLNNFYFLRNEFYGFLHVVVAKKTNSDMKDVFCKTYCSLHLIVLSVHVYLTFLLPKKVIINFHSIVHEIYF